MDSQTRSLYDQLRGRSNNYSSHADEAQAVMPAKPRLTGGALMNKAGNPSFSAQFDLSLKTRYFTLNGGAYTSIAASALNAALKNPLPFFLFGQGDFNSGFKKIKSQYAINSNWTYGIPFIYGVDSHEGGLALDATATADLQTGDLVIPFTSALPGTGTTTLALNIVRCNSVGYGTLLDALSSDTFVLNRIRYILPDTTQTDQFSNDIGLYNLSLFGKFGSDFITPNANKNPNQYQDGIIDIPIMYGVDKHHALGFENLYTNINQSMSIFVYGYDKVSAQ